MKKVVMVLLSAFCISISAMKMEEKNYCTNICIDKTGYCAVQFSQFVETVACKPEEFTPEESICCGVLTTLLAFLAFSSL